MKFRLALTSIVLLGLSFWIYYIAQWLASDGLDVASRQLIPMFAALLATVLIWAIWNIDLKLNIRPSKNRDSINDNLEKRSVNALTRFCAI